MAIITDNLDREFRMAKQGSVGSVRAEREPLPGPLIVHAGGTIGKSGSTNVTYSSPEIRSPLLNLVNFYLPYDRRTLNQWIRYYDRFQPMIGNAIDMHGEFPISDFRLTEIEDDEILDFYEQQKERANLVGYCFETSREYELIGEASEFFPFDEDDGMWDEGRMLNPDLLDIQMINWAGKREMIYSYEPEQELKKVVHSQSERVQEALQNMDPVVLDAIYNNDRIPLSEFNVLSLIRRGSPYDTRGTSILLRCFTPDTMVWLADGARKPIKDIMIGDVVLDGDGKLTNVVAVHKNSNPEKIITIEDSLGSKIEATNDHKFFAMRPTRGRMKTCPHMYSNGSHCGASRTPEHYTCDPPTCKRFGGKIEEIPAGDLQKWDYMLTPLPVVEEKPIEVDPWILGYFLGDGSRMGRWEMNFCGCTSGVGMNVQSRIKSYLDSQGVHYRVLQQPNYWRVSFCNHKLRIRYEELLGGLTCKTKRLSQEIINLPRAQLEQFIQGWFDADGHQVPEGTERISTANLTLAHQLQFLLLRLGIWSSLQKHRNDYPCKVETITRNNKGRVIYSVRFRRSPTKRFSFENYVRDGYLFTRVKKVQSREYHGETHCITVDAPNHTFVAGGKKVANCLKDLLYEDKLREVQYAIADHHITPIQLWKLGDAASGYMPTSQELLTFRAMLEAGAHDPLFQIVTHAAVNLDLIGYTGHLLPVIPEFEWVESRILTGLYTNKAMTSGEGPAIQAGAVVAMKVIQGRYQTKRENLRRLMVKKIFEPLARHHGFYETTPAELSHRIRRPKKDRKVIVPDIEWNFKLDLTNESQRIQFLVQLRQGTSPDLPMRTICEILDLDYNTVKKHFKEEEGTPFDPVYKAARTAKAEETGTVPGGATPSGAVAPPGGGTEIAPAPEEGVAEATEEG